MISDLYEVVPTYITEKERLKGNKEKSWAYGYNKKFDLIVISKDGTLGQVYYMNGLYIGLPDKPDEIDSEHNKWKPTPIPVELDKIKSTIDWEHKSNDFKLKWLPYIDKEFERRSDGHWFMNNNVPTYITGSHYMYLQWSKIDMGLPYFREANRLFWIYWEACVADDRCFGMCYIKNRRSGFSFMAASELANIATISKNARLGMLSKTADDAKKMFTDKTVPIVRKYPFFFKPIQDGMDNPKTELAFRIPATKLTKKGMMKESEESDMKGLDTSIDWKATEDNSYDGEKLLRLSQDEAGKWEKPKNIKNNWKVTKTCLRLGSRIIGKCMMGSTVNALKKGGQNFKDIAHDSNPKEKRNGNGQTKSGLYLFFIPMEDNFEGHIDEFGFPVYHDPVEPIIGEGGDLVTEGSIDYWERECQGLRGDSEGLNEHYRQFPRTLSHAFRDEASECLFDLTKINDQIDYNDTLIRDGVIVQGSFSWRDGVRFSEVVWTPSSNGRFFVTWIPPKHLQNRVMKKGDRYYPMNDHLGAFGADTYDISGTVGGVGSKGTFHGKTMAFVMEDKVPHDFFFLKYAARPPEAEIFFEDGLMMLWFYGMPILAENNKPRFLYHLKNAGCRGFSLNRPDRPKEKLSKTEIELGGIPSNSEDIIHAHAAEIERYINKKVGYDREGTYRPPDEIGNMYFNSTLEDWSKLDLKDRTKRDESISSGYAIMATNRHAYIQKKEVQKTTIVIPRFDNSGHISRRLK